MASFGVATNREWTSGTERKQDTEFHQIVAWGKLAEICQKLIQKGHLVYVEGYLKTRSWDNEDGTRSFRTEVIADEVILLTRDKKRDHDGYSENQTTQEVAAPTAAPVVALNESIEGNAPSQQSENFEETKFSDDL